jgi:hypothetical protein
LSSISEETEQKVKLIYNDVWKIYKEYLEHHDMAQFNKRIPELRSKYYDNEFLLSILWAFVPVITKLHAEYLKGCGGNEM